MRKIISILKRSLKKLYIKRKMSTYQIAEYYGYSQEFGKSMDILWYRKV